MLIGESFQQAEEARWFHAGTESGNSAVLEKIGTGQEVLCCAKTDFLPLWGE